MQLRRKKDDTVFFIMCISCKRRGRVNNDSFPSRCPSCGQKFNNKPLRGEEKTITDVLYNMIVKPKAEHGYYICDHMGWVKGDDIKFPYERY